MDIQTFENALRIKFGVRPRRGKSKNGVEYKLCCPFCPGNGMGRDNGYKLWVNPTIGKYRCWRCSAKGTVAGLLGVNVGDIPVETSVTRERRISDIAPGEILVPLQDLDDDNLAVRYLRDRGYDPAAMGRVYGLHYCESGRTFMDGDFDTTGTVVFPIWMSGKVVGWQARLLYTPEDLNDNECEARGFRYDTEKQRFVRPPKYFTSPGLTKGDVLYNYDVAKTSNVVVVVEGPTDTMATGPSAVGTLGKGVSDRQIDMLKAWDTVIVMLDPGDARKEMRDMVHALSSSVTAIQVVLEGIDDPGSGKTVEIWAQIHRACRRHGIDTTKFKLGPHWSPAVLKRR